MPSALWGPEKALKNIPKVEKQTNNKLKITMPREILKVLKTLLKWSAFCHKLQHMPLKCVHLQKRTGVLRLRSSQEDKELCNNTKKNIFVCVCVRKNKTQNLLHPSLFGGAKDF